MLTNHKPQEEKNTINQSFFNKQQLVLSRFTWLWLHAKVSKKNKSIFQEFITDYFETRAIGFFVLSIFVMKLKLTLNSCRIWAKVKFLLYRFHQSRQNK
jgi:hypothetical protein